MVSRVLANFAHAGISVYILPGNHDAVDRDGQVYTLQFYGELQMDNIHVLGHEVVDIEGIKFHCVPWLPELRARKRIKLLASKLAKKDTNVLLFHQSIVGAVGESGWVCDVGLEPDLAESFDLAMTGHYHTPQLVDGCRYLGAPLHFRFSDDDGSTRGFWVVDFKKKKLEPAQVRTEFPVFGNDEIRLDKGDRVEDLVDLEESSKGLTYLRIKVFGPAETINANKATLAKWRGDAGKWGLRAIKLDYRPDREVRQRIKVDPTLSLTEMARRYADAFGKDENPAELTRIGADLLERAEK